MSPLRRLIMLFGLLLLAASLVLLAWANWPVERITQIEPLDPPALTLPTPESFFIPAPFAQLDLSPERWL